MDALHHVLDPAGSQAAHIAGLWWITVAICAAVFVAILVALLVALRRAPRATPQTPPDITPLHAPEKRAVSVVVGALALSIVGLSVLLVASVGVDRALAQLPLNDAVNLEITAKQWWWDVHYDDADPSRAFSTANEIVVPVGRPVLVKLKADDVIHSFWVPNLHGKKDLIPGRIATTQFIADRAGTYRGQCAEFCGLQHAFMAFIVTAVPPEQYERWADAQRKPAAEPSGDAAKHGRDLFLSGTCMMCHAIQGTPANAHKGPDLTHVASRATLAAGTIPNTAERLAAWISDPQKIKPGVNMPSHHVAREDLDALVAYVGGLK